MSDYEFDNSDVDLDKLTEEERAALEEESADDAEADEDDEADATDSSGEADSADAEQEDEGEEEGEGSGEAEGEAEGDPATPAENEDESAGSVAERDEDYTRAPLLSPGDIEGAEDRLKEIDDKRKELRQREEELFVKFDDGEITPRELQSSLGELAKEEQQISREERGIEREVFKAQIANEMDETRARNEWMTAVNTFLGSHPQYKEKKLMYLALDATVKDIASQEENQNLTYEQILTKSHEQVIADLGLQERSSGEEGKAAPKAKKRPQDSIPPTLAGIPASDITETDRSPWARLNRLAETDPIRYERELRKLSPADQDAYAQSQ